MLSPFSHCPCLSCFFFSVLTSILLPCFLQNLFDSWIVLDFTFCKCCVFLDLVDITSLHLLCITLLPTPPGFLSSIKQGFVYASLERELHSWCPVIITWKGSCGLAKVRLLFTVLCPYGMFYINSLSILQFLHCCFYVARKVFQQSIVMFQYSCYLYEMSTIFSCVIISRRNCSTFGLLLPFQNGMGVSADGHTSCKLNSSSQMIAVYIIYAPFYIL